MLKKIDIYIIKKFLGTYFFAIGIIILISVIFDLTEKLDNFIEKEASVESVIFDYYLNFIPYFANLFSSLFTFIAVIFFTSKLAYNTEIIAMLSGGVSFARLLRPYMIAATAIVLMSYLLSSWVIPHANRERLAFEDKYVSSMKKVIDRDIHVEIEPGVFVYIQMFNSVRNSGTNVTIEQFENNQLISKTSAQSIRFNKETKKWKLNEYITRHIKDGKEEIERGRTIDTTLSMVPEDFIVIKKYQETLNNTELSAHIKKQKARGLDNVEPFIIEKYRRVSDPFSALILTIIGVAVSSRKVRGGTGFHIGIGLVISFSYIFFIRVSTTFAINGDMPPFVAVWLPNFIYAFVAFWMYKKAPK